MWWLYEHLETIVVTILTFRYIKTKYIKTALKKDCGLLIRLLIKEVILYDDKVEIYYNYIDYKRRPDGDNHQAFSFYKDTFTTIVDRKEYYKEAIELKLNLECFCI